MVVTDSQLYQFLGNTNFELLFKKYKEGKAIESACKNFPQEGTILRSKLQFYHSKSNQLQSFGWMTMAGFCYGQFGSDPFDKIVRNFIIIPYAKIKRDGSIDLGESPISIAHSEYHIFLLFPDCISIISKITANIIHTEHINDSIISMHYNKAHHCIWMNSNKKLYRYVIENEDRDIWKAYLEKEEYDMALAVCKNKNSIYSKKVAKLYGNHLFEKGDYINSAVKYGDSDEKFEEVTLKFLIHNKYDALKSKQLLFCYRSLPQHC